MKIAICDDNRTVIEQVEQYIEIINDKTPKTWKDKMI